MSVQRLQIVTNKHKFFSCYWRQRCSLLFKDVSRKAVTQVNQELPCPFGKVWRKSLTSTVHRSIEVSFEASFCRLRHPATYEHRNRYKTRLFPLILFLIITFLYYNPLIERALRTRVNKLRWALNAQHAFNRVFVHACLYSSTESARCEQYNCAFVRAWVMSVSHVRALSLAEGYKRTRISEVSRLESEYSDW